MFTRNKINLLRLLALALTALAVGSVTRAEPLISEFMAANSRSLADSDGAFSDWVEIHNPDTQAISLEGWYLTDAAANKTKWKFPAVILPAGGYMVVYASNKNRTDPTAPLHTNFALSADGEYLGLIKPDGVTVAHEYAPRFPAQSDDVSYGLVQNPDGSTTTGILSAPTPGAANSGQPTGGGNSGTGNVADDEFVTFSRPSGLFRSGFSVELSGADIGQQIRYTVSTGISPAAAAEPTANSPAYTAPITIQGSATIRAAVFDANGGRGPVTSVVYTKIGNSAANFSSQLPVLVLDTMGTGPLVKDDIDHASALSVYAPRGGAPVFFGTPELVTPLESSVRGSSSADFPKKGYNVKFTDEAGDKQAQPLLDMASAEKWAFVGPWSFDFSYLNNSLVYGLSNQMGRWAPRTRFAEMFFNADGNDLDYTDYAGIYTLTERIEVGASRVNIRKLSSKDISGDALTGGYILKIDPADPDEIGWTTPHGVTSNSSIVLVAPKADDIVPEQLDYIQNFTRQMEAALVHDQTTGFAQRSYLDYIDRASWVDYHLLTVFTSNPDGLVRSTYFHKDRGGKLVAGPVWDYDRALGSVWERSRNYDEWFGAGAPDFWNTGWWGILARDPEFMQEWVDRWQALRHTTFSEGNLTEMVRTLGSAVGEAAAARDAARWPDNAPMEGSYAAEVDYKLRWVVGRAGWIDQQFVTQPTVAYAGGTITFTAPAQAQLIYTLDGSDPRAQGGAIAPGAIITNGPLTVASNANVHVRAYRADLKETFPGTPWSSAVGGEQSSPLNPKARLINISSRAAVGSGANALIMGVTVADTEGKRYLSRGIGPGLVAFGATGVVMDPQLSIYGPTSAELFRNNGWETGIDASRLPGYARAVGAFPLVSGSADSALASQIGSGGYTVQVSTPSGQEGIGLAELYELDGKGRTVNLSTRARVGTGDGVLIGGFVVSGPAYKRLLIRGVGPTLSAFGLADALADPVLTVRSGTDIVATNDRWQSGANTAAVAAASTAVGAFTLANGSEDAAMVVTLPPGAYTVEITGKSGHEGIALLEIYELP